MLSKGTIRNKGKNSDKDTQESLLLFQFCVMHYFYISKHKRSF